MRKFCAAVAATVQCVRSNCNNTRGPSRAGDSVQVKASFPKPLVLVWILFTLGLPALLLFSAGRTYRALENQKIVYLRSRMAALSAQLETLPDTRALESLDEEPGLIDLVILEPPSNMETDPLADLWLARELFRTESVRLGGQAVFRAFVPFHGRQGLRLARIDIAESSAEFLVEPARRHLWFVGLAALVIVVLSVFTAWSARRASEAERRQLDLQHLAHIGEMSAVLAHEIRNPLGTIKGFAQLLAEKLSPTQTELLNPILSETARLEGLVKDLLLYGRPAQPSLRPTSTLTIAATLLAHANHIAGATKVDFQQSVADVTFETDPNLLEQALLNLVRNAIEALHGRTLGSVRLEAEVVGNDIVWRVVDDGPGLSEEARMRLFEPFYTSKAFGTGLGLSITRKLAEALGGRFTITNRPEAGTAAEIRLPRKAAVRVH